MINTLNQIFPKHQFIINHDLFKTHVQHLFEQKIKSIFMSITFGQGMIFVSICFSIRLNH